MKRAYSPILLIILLAVGLATPATGQVYSIDYIGFCWEAGGLVPSNAGDELFGAMIADCL